MLKILTIHPTLSRDGKKCLHLLGLKEGVVLKENPPINLGFKTKHISIQSSKS